MVRENRNFQPNDVTSHYVAVQCWNVTFVSDRLTKLRYSTNMPSSHEGSYVFVPAIQTVMYICVCAHACVCLCVFIIISRKEIRKLNAKISQFFISNCN